MANVVRRCLPHLLFLVSIPAFAQGWIQPTPDELKMTVDPAAPNAAAIYLYRDERADDKLHMHSLYVRMKILTEEGKKYADVELVYDQGRSFSIRAIDGRTIHSDGTVIPFAGKPYDKVLEKTKTESYKSKVFTLPDVQVGSILEYRYVLAYDDDWVLPPQWYLAAQHHSRRRPGSPATPRWRSPGAAFAAVSAAEELPAFASTYSFVAACNAAVGSAASVSGPVRLPPESGSSDPTESST